MLFSVKKLLLFCLLLCLLLSGCGQTVAPQPTITPTQPTTIPTDPEENGPVPPEEFHGPLPLVEIGEFSDVPGGIITLDDLKDIELMRLEVVDEYGFKYIYAWEYSFALGRFIMYFAEEVYDEQTIYVEKGENIDCYISTYADTEFYLDPSADQIGYSDDLGYFTDCVNLFVSYSTPKENTRYKRIEDQDTLTGEAYAYEIYTGDVHTGYLLIDKATGLAVTQTNTEKKANYQIGRIDTENAGIPQYK